MFLCIFGMQPLMDWFTVYVLTKIAVWRDTGKFFNQEKYPEVTQTKTIWEYFDLYAGPDFPIEE